MLGESYENSPRRKHLVEAGGLTFKNGSPTFGLFERVSQLTTFELAEPDAQDHSQSNGSHSNEQSSNPPLSLTPPLPILLKTFLTYTDLKEDYWFNLTSYFECVHVNQGDVLWHQGDEPDGLYLIESGMLKAVYDVSGVLCFELVWLWYANFAWFSICSMLNTPEWSKKRWCLEWSPESYPPFLDALETLRSPSRYLPFSGR